MKNQGYRITAVTAAAKHLDVRAGDRLLQVNGEPLLDFIDWNYWATHSHLELRLERDGAEFDVMLDKQADRAIGIELEEALYPRERHCTNRCCFCFVDQLPKEMRPSLYDKDDDWRLPKN
jgi:NifB/MoaA-like Fe-S oxidoreductase